MVIRIGRLIPPGAGVEHAPTDHVRTTSSFPDEFAAPFVEHFLVRQLAAVRIVQAGRSGRKITRPDGVQQLCGACFVTGPVLAFGLGIINFR